MYVRLKHLVVSSALVGATLTGTSVAQAAGAGHVAPSGSRMTSAAGFVHATGACKKDQVDACKPGGCCIVD